MPENSFRSFYAESVEFCERLVCDVTLFNGCKSKQFTAIWDTGAMTTNISNNVVEFFGLVPIGTMKLGSIYATQIRPKYEIGVELPGGFRYCDLCVVGVEEIARNIDVIIGMDIISVGDFAVSNYNGKTSFSFRFPSQGPIDLTK